MLLFLVLLAMTPIAPIEPPDPILLYQRGSYRRVIEALHDKENLSQENEYRLIQSVLIMQGNDKAWEVLFDSGLAKEPTIHPFFKAFLIQSLLEDPLPTNQVAVLPQLQRWLALNNPFLSTNTVERLYWNAYRLDPRTPAPARFPHLETTRRHWENFLAGDPSGLPQILGSRVFLTIFWQSFTNTLVRQTNLPPQSHQGLWAHLRRLPPSIQSLLVREHIPTISPARRWIAETEHALAVNQPSRAVQAIETALASNHLTSIEDHQRAITWANQMRNHALTERIAFHGIQRFGAAFHFDYTRALIRQGEHQNLIAWHQANEDSIINRRVILSVFRSLVERNAPNLRQWLSRQVERFPHQTFLFTYALILIDENQTKEAYRLLLRIMFEHPYTYEWLAARDYEARLRTSYPALFQEWRDQSTNSVLTLPIQRRLLSSLALHDITGILPAPRQFSNDLLQFQRSFLATHFSISDQERALFNRLLALTNTIWTTFPRELSAYIDRELETPRNRNNFAWYGYELYRQSDSLGVPVGRLDTIVRRYANRESILLFPPAWQKKLYPIEPLWEILPMITNTNHALWVLASYRQESHFRKHVTSSAGAYGFVQLMPATAEQLARNLRRPYLSRYDYKDNIFLGNTLYRSLFRRYDNIPHALAAYNAGEGAVNRWRRRHPTLSLPLWIENIPFEETRNYIKVIWQQTALYRKIHEDTLGGFVPILTE